MSTLLKTFFYIILYNGNRIPNVEITVNEHILYAVICVILLLKLLSLKLYKPPTTLRRGIINFNVKMVF